MGKLTMVSALLVWVLAAMVAFAKDPKKAEPPKAKPIPGLFVSGEIVGELSILMLDGTTLQKIPVILRIQVLRGSTR